MVVFRCNGHEDLEERPLRFTWKKEDNKRILGILGVHKTKNEVHKTIYVYLIEGLGERKMYNPNVVLGSQICPRK